MGSRSSTTRPSSTRQDPSSTVIVGSIRRPHGVRGEVLIEVLTDVEGRFAAGSELLVSRRVGGPGSETAVERRLEVVAARPHRSRRGADDLLVRFDGIGDREAAEELRGAYLEIEEPAAAAVSAGMYYHYQLLGCRCRDRREGDLGEVVDLLEDGGGLILIVGDGDRRVPVPFVESFLVEIDVEARRIEVDLPPGLVEICASRS